MDIISNDIMHFNLISKRVFESYIYVCEMQFSIQSTLYVLSHIGVTLCL